MHECMRSDAHTLHTGAHTGSWSAVQVHETQRLPGRPPGHGAKVLGLGSAKATLALDKLWNYRL